MISDIGPMIVLQSTSVVEKYGSSGICLDGMLKSRGGQGEFLDKGA
jgi:hypothetical protein